VDEVSGLLRMRGCGEYRAVIALQNLEPVRNIGGVIRAGLKCQLKIGTEESCSQLSHEFFLGIRIAAETVAAEVAVKAVLGAAPVSQFMCKR